jgi:hypothetical protein
MKIDYNINNTQKISLVFLRWYPNEKNFEELTSDDFFSIDDITVSESDGVISYSHVEDRQFYKTNPSNLSEVTDKFNFLVEITFDKVDYFKSNLVTNTNKMQSIRLMTYHILSKDKSIQRTSGTDPIMELNHLNINVRKTYTMGLRPIRILERDCIDGKYELNLLIKEFLRDSKLDDLGI